MSTVINPHQLGMKWYNFFTKVRPWIGVVFGMVNLLSITISDNVLLLLDVEICGLALVILNAIDLLGLVATIVLQLILVVKVSEKADNLLSLIKGLLLFEVVFYTYDSALAQYYEQYYNGQEIDVVAISSLMIFALMIFALWYFIWYRCNMKYFKKRLVPSFSITDNTTNVTEAQPTQLSLSNENETPTRTYGDFNVCASDLALVQDDKIAQTPPAPQPKVSPPAPVQAPAPKKKKSPVKYCSRCGHPIDAQTKKCTGCGKQYFKGVSWKTIVIAVLSLLLIASVALNVSLYIENNELCGTSYLNVSPKVMPSCVGVRMISLSDELTAEYVLATWKLGEATEESMVEIMDEYGAQQGGGQLYVVEPGDYVEEIEEWCFALGRRVGDVAIIENDYGYTICYISFLKH